MTTFPKFREALATYDRSESHLAMVSYTFDRTQSWDENSARQTREQAPLTAIVTKHGGEIASGAGETCLTLYGPVAMYEEILDTPNVTAPIRSFEEYRELKIHI